MSQPSPIRFSVLVTTLFLLGVCLLLLYQFRPVPAVSQPELITSLNSVENARRTNQGALARLAHGARKANSRSQIASSTAALDPSHSQQPAELYRALQESDDPQEKRKLRKQMASIKPGEVPFRFALEKYTGATDEEEKLHLQSIVSQIDVSEFASEVASVASQTPDESLFVSLAYALRNSKTTLAKQELFQLAAKNQLPVIRTNSPMSNQGLVALHRCLLDTLQPSDLAWVNQYATTNPLNTVQSSIVSSFMAKTNRP